MAAASAGKMLGCTFGRTNVSTMTPGATISPAAIGAAYRADIAGNQHDEFARADGVRPQQFHVRGLQHHVRQCAMPRAILRNSISPMDSFHVSPFPALLCVNHDGDSTLRSPGLPVLACTRAPRLPSGISATRSPTRDTRPDLRPPAAPAPRHPVSSGSRTRRAVTCPLTQRRSHVVARQLQAARSAAGSAPGADRDRGPATGLAVVWVLEPGL